MLVESEKEGERLTSLAVTPLIPGRTGTDSRGSACPSVHALGIAECRHAVLSHVPFRTLAKFLMIAPATIGTLPVALGVRANWTCKTAIHWTIHVM